MSLIRRVAERIFSAMGTYISYKVGTMIEIPRAALVADEVSNSQIKQWYLILDKKKIISCVE